MDPAEERHHALQRLSPAQALGVLDLQVRRFAGQESRRIIAERDELLRRVAELPG